MNNKFLLKNANESLIRGNLQDALKNYFSIISLDENFAKILIPNIKIAINKFNKIPTKELLIVNEDSSVHELCKNNKLMPDEFLIIKCNEETEYLTNNIIVFSTDLNINSENVLNYVVENQVGEILIGDISISSLFLGLIYELVWGVNVKVISRISKKKINLIRYLNEEATPGQLPIIASVLPRCLIAIIKYISSSDDVKVYLKWFNIKRRASKLYNLINDFDQSSEDGFVRFLYQFSLGRAPFSNELNHFVGSLLSGELTRKDIVFSVCNGEECRRHVADNFKPNNLLDYLIPEYGDIDPYEINIPYRKNPIVSVLIPVYGKIEYTLACLKSISENIEKISFEVLVLDDRSPDNSVSILKKVRNIKIIENPQNLGFLKSCNHGATYARGKYLYFLNNDTVVRPGWLDELVKTFHIFPGTGLAGSKLIYPDNSLQEAGGILWQDGSAWNYGNKQQPDLPEFTYAREVDYISGASIMVPTDLYNDIGGFDQRYAPAYCEDSDLALEIRARRLRVIYQPMSEVIHFEGVTSGTDTGQGVKSYQVKNSKTLYSKWKELLKSHRPNGENPDDEKDRCMRKRVLVIEHCTPTPDQDAGSVSVFNILLLLREMGFQVTFIPEDNFLYLKSYTNRLQKAGIEVLYSPFVRSVEEHLMQKGSRYDLAFMFRPRVVEKHVHLIEKYCPKAKKLFYTHDLHHIRMKREAELTGDKQMLVKAELMKLTELMCMYKMDTTILVSTAELDILEPQLPNCRLRVLPLLLNIPKTKVGYDSRADFCFVGGFQHTPNIDAVIYFVNSVMPIVRKKIPGIKFHIVGSNPTQDVLSLACEDVIVHGFVNDLNGFLDAMRLSIAPLRYGAGVKGKVGTSMAAGLPSVLSSVAAEGMNLIDGEHALISDSPTEMANAIEKIYIDNQLWNKISNSSISYAEYSWGPESSFNSLHKIIQELFPDFNSTPTYPLILYSEEFL